MMFLPIQYGVGNLALNGLNWLWFSKIMKRTIRTLKGDKKGVVNRQETVGKAVNGNAN
jgi:hypothetical protein